MLIGYARCSVADQDLEAQRQQLHQLGVDDDRIYSDHGKSGATADRPGLQRALAACREGDTFVVTKLDRLARSVPDARAILEDLHSRGICVSIGGTIYNPHDPAAKLLVTVLAMVAEFERDLIAQRTREGLAIARQKGRLRGTKPKLKPKVEATMLELHAQGQHTVAEICEMYQIGRATFYRAQGRVKERELKGRHSD